MAKELLIVFVYDCEMCKKEEDDPQDAIIYFYPTWVSREQRHALCSQLMGVTQFFLSSFSLPKVISLQSGKFAIKKLGHYILCVGTDRNIPDIVLELRSKTLYKLLRTFHFDIESLQSSLSEEDDNNLSERLAELFQVYLPILHFATNKFGNIPVFKLPKSASNVFLESMQILKSFQEIPGVLGGMILYQNKVITTQLNYSLTKQLVVSDPYRIKLPAESVTTPFHLPVGVQLLSMYIERAEIGRLQAQNSTLHAALKEVASWRKEAESLNIPKVGKSGMKRDTSRIFSTVVEEEVPDLVKEAVRARQLARLETVAPASFVLAPSTLPHLANTTDSLPQTCPTNLPIRYYSLGLPNVESEWCDELDKKKGSHLRPYYNTICDPKYPLFKANGLPVSESLFQIRLSGHYDCLKSIENTPKKKNSGFSSSSRGVPLTPLMAKLSVLAQEETPLRPKTPAIAKTPISVLPRTTEPIKKTVRVERRDSDGAEDLVPVVLYVFGHNNTSLLLVLEQSVAVDPDSIHSMWERSMNTLSSLETNLENCCESNRSDGGDYSYVVVDPAWGPVQRGGPYQPHQLQLLTLLHQALTTSPNFTDILLRTDDTVSYGYQCGETQVYYQQNCAGWSGGLPTPADSMGVVALKAKRRLERDHGIVLL